jgi:hypothetical protein
VGRVQCTRVDPARRRSSSISCSAAQRVTPSRSVTLLRAFGHVTPSIRSRFSDSLGLRVARSRLSESLGHWIPLAPSNEQEMQRTPTLGCRTGSAERHSESHRRVTLSHLAVGSISSPVPSFHDGFLDRNAVSDNRRSLPPSSVCDRWVSTPASWRCIGRSCPAQHQIALSARK